ncbi:importin alpha re-exporter [Neolentinus lepideus HHB14362 ss-1]|uniref:Importin alpha re-exporter n=1 Tax=Neolentinus lepideus HHB14362 ss-1 TaxID=1314782 RepID=A0A165MI35_9AGAM|nr:importin alpha re-exporter [Neolentinus lepideus HHB14362 ss-1]
MLDLTALFLSSLDPSSGKLAKQSLHSLSQQLGFFPHLLTLIITPTQDRPARLAASVYLKNVVKNRWDDDTNPIPPAYQAAIRTGIVPAIISLSSPTDKAMRAQLLETAAVIAAFDFPEKLSDLMDTFVTSLSGSDYMVNLAILETAHTVFFPWRSKTRTDELYLSINYVFARFLEPFLAFFRCSAALLISSPSPASQTLAASMVEATKIFYDLTSLAMPPAIKDAHAEFFKPEEGWFTRFMVWNPAELRGDQDDHTPSLPDQLKMTTMELVELYLHKYPEMLVETKTVEAIVQIVWDVLGSGVLQGARDDAFVSQSLHFISTVIRSDMYKHVFRSRETISNLIQSVVIPNIQLREYELEQFEDHPLMFVRQDLAIPGTGDTATRRQAAADVVRALVASGAEVETTEVVGAWIARGLAEYEKDRDGVGWKAKDSAVYLMGAVAAKAATTQHGVTATNELVDVVEFFSNNVFQDLQVPRSNIHPVLQVDVMKFLYAFHAQLSKEQLLTVLPLLQQYLKSENTVCYTYAAIAIERILCVRRGTELLFACADIRDFAPNLLDLLLSKIESGGSTQKVAENEYLMQCVMRVIVAARQTLMPVYQQVLSRLMNILGIISQSPSNPSFDWYIFESTSALIRFVVAGNPNTLAVFEQTLFGPITVILQQDVEQYIPYVFQLLAQMLTVHTVGAPTGYRGLLQFLVQPPVWGDKCNVPGLVKLLKAFLAKDTAYMVESGSYMSVMAVVHRLISSRNNYTWGFKLLEGVIVNIPGSTMKQCFRPLIMELLNRMQTNKTDKYIYHFTRFFIYGFAMQIDNMNPDLIIGTVEEVQQGLWTNVLKNIILPQVPKMPPRDRKLIAVALTRMLTHSEKAVQPGIVDAWPLAFTALAKLFSEPQHLKSSPQSPSDADVEIGLTQIDYEEQTAGYQSAYSRLVALEGPTVDPVAYVVNVQEYFVKEIAAWKEPRKGTLIGVADQSVTGAVVATLREAGAI